MTHDGGYRTGRYALAGASLIHPVAEVGIQEGTTDDSGEREHPHDSLCRAQNPRHLRALFIEAQLALYYRRLPRGTEEVVSPGWFPRGQVPTVPLVSSGQAGRVRNFQRPQEELSGVSTR